MKVNVCDSIGNGYYGVELVDFCDCNCKEDIQIIAGKKEHAKNYVWVDQDYSYRQGTCIGQEICCKHCGKVIGNSIKDAALQIGVTRSGLGNNDDYIQFQGFLKAEIQKQNFQKDNKILTGFKMIINCLHTKKR